MGSVCECGWCMGWTHRGAISKMHNADTFGPRISDNVKGLIYLLLIYFLMGLGSLIFLMSWAGNL